MLECMMTEAKAPLIPDLPKGSPRFLQVVVVLLGLLVLAFLLWEPQVEGRNARATQFEIYFKDPFLAYLYLSSIPFFVGLYQAIRLLGRIGRNEAFSEAAVGNVRMIRRCATAIVGLVIVAVIWARMANTDPDDGPQAVFMGGITALASIIVAKAAGTFERLLQNGVDIKNENDLTV